MPVEAGGADATVAGAAALAAVGAGVLASLLEAAELLPVDRRVEPTRDDAVARRRARALAGVRVGGGRAALAADQAPLAGAGGASGVAAASGSMTRPRSSRSSVRTGPL